MAVNDQPRLAVIGCGAVMEHHLLPALLRIGWRPSLLVDPVPERTGLLARRIGRGATAPAAGTDWRMALEPGIDAALIATPHALHGPIGLALLRHGRHVFVEKPLAVTAADAMAMVEAAQATGAVLSVGTLRRHLLSARWLKGLIASGRLGAIRRFTVREGFIYNWAVSTDATWRRASAGGGVLIDTGAHTLDLLLWWLGDVASLDYRDDSQGGVETECRIDLTLTSGATGRVELSRLRTLPNTIAIEGEHGHVEMHVYRNEIIAASPGILDFVHDGIDPRNLPRQLFTELFEAEFHDFHDCIRTGRTPVASGAPAARTVALIERCYAARQPLDPPWAEAAHRLKIAPPPACPAIAPGTRCLVTGGTGFIGGRLVERLSMEHGAAVRCLVRNFAQAARIARHPVEMTAGGLLDRDALDRAVAGSDVVFHCAYDVRSPRQNREGMANLIAACLRHKVRRLVFLSTFSVYEPLPDGDVDETTRDGDTAWLYTRTKLELERMVLTAARERGLPAVVLQPTIVYGPFGRYWTDQPVQWLLGGTVVLPEGGQGLCNAVHVDDLTDAMLLAARRDDAASERLTGERFIISGPDRMPWADYFRRYQEMLGVDALRFQPAAAILRRQRSLSRNLRMVLDDPRWIVRLIVRWHTARRTLQFLLDSLPRGPRQWVIRHYFAEHRPSGPRIFLPDPQMLALFTARAVVRIDKAQRLLGYRPRFFLADGLDATAAYVRWAYDIPVGASTAEAVVPSPQDRSSQDRAA